MKGQHIRGLNGIKGLAILMVISYHLFPSVTSGGFLWVNSFFVLGGFFLARSMEKIQEGNRPHALRNYVLKTVQRLWWPLLVFILIMLAYLLAFDRRELSYDRSDILSSLFFFNNYFQISAGRSYFTQMAGTSPFTHLWYNSLYVQSFLVGVAGIWVTQKAYFSAYYKAAFWLALMSLSHTLTFYLYQPSGDPSLVYYGLATRFASVAGGIALAYLLPIFLNACYRYQHKQAMLNILALVSVALMLVLSFTASDQAGITYYLWLPAFNILTMLLVLALVGGATLGRLVFDWGFLTHFGRRSYSFYLWYYPLLTGLLKALPHTTWTAVLVLLVILLASEIFYWLVEARAPQPVWTWGSRFKNAWTRLRQGGWRWPDWRKASLGLVGALVLVVGLLLAADYQRLALFELEYLAFTNKTHVQKAIYPGTEAMDALQTDLKAVDTTFKTDYVTPQSRQTVLDKAIKASQVNAEMQAFFEENKEVLEQAAALNPELVAMLSPVEIIYATTQEVSLFGDSVALLNSSTFSDIFWQGNTYGKVSLSVYKGAQEILQDRVWSGLVKPKVVIQLGVNGGLDTDSMDQLMAILQGREVYFVTVHNADGEDTEVNSYIKDTARRYPNAHVIDWQAYQVGHPEWYVSDGVHHNEVGTLHYVAFIARSLYQQR